MTHWDHPLLVSEEAFDEVWSRPTDTPILIVVGSGFDPRATVVLDRLANTTDRRVDGVLIDLPETTTAIAEGAHSSEVTPNGKPGPDLPDGSRHGLNDYTGWFAGDEQMKGHYFGYDGPCPPWNDSIRHHYVFTVYALDIATLPVSGAFNGQEARNAMAGHILAQASLTVTYSLNPGVPA